LWELGSHADNNHLPYYYTSFLLPLSIASFALLNENNMATTTSVISAHSAYKPSFTLFSRFFAWCSKQEKNRIMWTGVSLALHGCVITPVTLLAVMLCGVPTSLLILTVFGIFITLVVNLAAMPTRITIPAFILSILVDVGVIVTAISMGLDFGKVF
jgi:hypothetical protein